MAEIFIPIDQLLDASFDYLDRGVPVSVIARAYDWPEPALLAAMDNWHVPLRPYDKARVPKSRARVVRRFAPPLKKAHETKEKYERRIARAWVAWILKDLPDLGRGLASIESKPEQGMPVYVPYESGISRNVHGTGLLARRRVVPDHQRGLASINRELRSAGLLSRGARTAKRVGRYWH